MCSVTIDRFFDGKQAGPDNKFYADCLRSFLSSFHHRRDVIYVFVYTDFDKLVVHLSVHPLFLGSVQEYKLSILSYILSANSYEFDNSGICLDVYSSDGFLRFKESFFAFLSSRDVIYSLFYEYFIPEDSAMVSLVSQLCQPHCFYSFMVGRFLDNYQSCLDDGVALKGFDKFYLLSSYSNYSFVLPSDSNRFIDFDLYNLFRSEGFFMCILWYEFFVLSGFIFTDEFVFDGNGVVVLATSSFFKNSWERMISVLSASHYYSLLLVNFDFYDCQLVDKATSKFFLLAKSGRLSKIYRQA